jgi:hypothetical protein
VNKYAIILFLIVCLIIVVAFFSNYHGRQTEREIWSQRLFEAEARIDTVWRDSVVYLPPQTGVGTGTSLPDYDTTYLREQIDSLTLAFESLEETVDYLAEPFNVQFAGAGHTLSISVQPIGKVVSYDLDFQPIVIKAPAILQAVYIRVPVDRKWTEEIWRYLSLFLAGGFISLVLF